MNDIKARLLRGEIIYGTHVFAGMPMLTEAMSECGKPFGVSTGCDKEFLEYWRSIGATIFFAGGDISYIHDGAVRTRDFLHKIK